MNTAIFHGMSSNLKTHRLRSAIVSRRRLLLSALLGVSLGACDAEDITTGEFAVDARSRVTGIVNSADGLPVANARVYLVFPECTVCGFVSPDVRTNARGEFLYLVERIGRPVQPPTPDTMTVSVEVAWPASPSPERTGRTSALLFFLPPEKAPPTTAVTVLLDKDE